jgi:hypothetical protein
LNGDGENGAPAAILKQKDKIMIDAGTENNEEMKSKVFNKDSKNT